MGKVTILILILSTVKLKMVKNPFKVCMKMMMVMIMTSILAWMKMALTWVPLFMFMIMTGGVLMIFMMISSLAPSFISTMNQSNTFILIIASAMWMSLDLSDLPLTKSQMSMMNEMTLNKYILILMIIILTLYFYAMTISSTSEQSSLRFHY